MTNSVDPDQSAPNFLIIANSVDPDQTASLGVCLQTQCICQNLSIRKLSIVLIGFKCG